MFAGYTIWHYSYAFRDGFFIFLDGTRFLYNFFSFRRLLATFFRPLRSNINSGAIGIFFSRCLGVLVRSSLLLMGIMAISGWVIFCAAVCIVWPFLPLLTLAGLVASIIGFIQHGL